MTLHEAANTRFGAELRLVCSQASRPADERLDHGPNAVTYGRVLQVAVGVEQLGRSGDHQLRFEHHERFGEDEHLAQRQLRTDGAAQAPGRAHERDRFVAEGRLARRTGGPVDGVLEYARDGIVVLWSGDQERVDAGDPVLQLADRLWSSVRFHVCVIEWDLTQLRDLDLHTLRGHFHGSPQQASVIGPAPQAARNPENSKASLVRPHALSSLSQA